MPYLKVALFIYGDCDCCPPSGVAYMTGSSNSSHLHSIWLVKIFALKFRVLKSEMAKIVAQNCLEHRKYVKQVYKL